MKRRLVVLGFLALGVLVVPAAAQAAGSDTTQLSSWRPDTSAGIVEGGHQTVTVINTSKVVLDDVVFPLDQAPCECTATSLSPTHGHANDEIWRIGTLAPGETATLDVTYTRTSTSTLVGASSTSISPLWIVGLLIAAGGLPLVLVRRPPHFAL
jgi:hypothetical protein